MNLATIIDRHPDDATALIARGKATTYGELRDETARLRGGLAELGVQRGDRVAIVAGNNLFVPSLHFAIVGLGAVVVPLNPTSPTAELRRQIEVVSPAVLVAGATGSAAAGGLDAAALGIRHVLAPEGVSLDGAQPLASVMGDPLAPVDLEPDTLAALLFTSGTAGSPRAAMLSHRNLLSNIEQMQQHPGRALSPDDVALGVLPMFHIFGLNVVLGLTLYAGGSVVLIERFDPSTALDSIARHHATIVAGAPPMFGAWATLPDVDPADMATVRLAVSGAAPLTAEVAEAFERRYGVPIWQGYGLTEASPTVTSSVVGGRPKPGSIGVPLPGIEVRLVDEEGEDALLGDEGEIWVRGSNVFLGYWNDAEATALALTEDGWLRTGDVAVADDDGFLFLVDRAKDLIIVSGFNVFPAEVEDALREHPGIADVAVVGVGHPHTGETVKAFVVPSPAAHVEEDEVIEFCASRLARYKCPTKVLFVDEIPHAPGSGKLLRRQLS